jgi:hypothetical protein
MAEDWKAVVQQLIADYDNGYPVHLIVEELREMLEKEECNTLKTSWTP